MPHKHTHTHKQVQTQTRAGASMFIDFSLQTRRYLPPRAHFNPLSAPYHPTCSGQNKLKAGDMAMHFVFFISYFVFRICCFFTAPWSNSLSSHRIASQGYKSLNLSDAFPLCRRCTTTSAKITKHSHAKCMRTEGRQQ